jgi:hypothetical protein
MKTGLRPYLETATLLAKYHMENPPKRDSDPVWCKRFLKARVKDGSLTPLERSLILKHVKDNNDE